MAASRPPRISSRRVAEILADLEVPDTPESRKLMRKLASSPAALHRTIRSISEMVEPDESALPNVDALVNKRLRSAYPSCTEPELLKKPSAIGPQNKRLLAALLARLGDPVPLQELLLINGLRSATPRRLRELRTEHGGFRLRAVGSGDSSAYVLESPKPDVAATAYYWLKRNIRDAPAMGAHERILALLSARLGEPVPLDELAYVVPQRQSSGRGRARSPQLAVARRLRDLRERGYRVQTGRDKTRAGLSRSDYLLETLEQLPPYERIPAKIREAVLEAAGYRCAHCGWGPVDGVDRGRKQLEVHHRQPQRARPEDVHNPAKLQVLCNKCHAGVEAKSKRSGP